MHIKTSYINPSFLLIWSWEKKNTPPPKKCSHITKYMPNMSRIFWNDTVSAWSRLVTSQSMWDILYLHKILDIKLPKPHSLAKMALISTLARKLFYFFKLPIKIFDHGKGLFTYVLQHNWYNYFKALTMHQ